MKIAIDAMGGDYAPDEIVKGAIEAIQELREDVLYLVGDEGKITKLLGKNKNPNIKIVHANQHIEMHESPSVAIKTKKRSSMKIAAELVKNKECDAMISAGNTGALLEVSLFTIGRIKGIKRPALAVLLPTKKSPCLLIDAGANADCKPEFLLQFAQMGGIYMEKIFGVKNPRVGLLNIGEESGKGNQLYRQNYDYLCSHKDINFVGNIEARSMIAGNTDVIVADGFVGNIYLKALEASAEFMQTVLKEEIKKSIVAKVAALTLKPIFRNTKKRLDHSEHGGALLLGLKGILLKCHGRADATTIINAIKATKKMHNLKMQNFIEKIALNKL